MVSTMSKLADKLRQARLLSGYTVERAADAIDTSTTSIWRYESGQRRPSGPTLHALAALYGTSVDWFFGEDKPQPERSIEADRELVMNEAQLALRSTSDELSDEAISDIADYIRFVREREERRRRERQGGG